MGIPTVVIVGADKGGVGKTTVTRALLDYMALKGVATRVFDTEYPAGILARFAPVAEIIDITRVKDQMRVFDEASDAAVTVLDLRAGVLSTTLAALDDAKLLDDVREGRMCLVVLHVLGATRASMEEVVAAARKIGVSNTHFLVKNHINATEFAESDKTEAERIIRTMDSVTVHVPQLAEDAFQAVDTAGVSFVSFGQRSESRVLRGKVRTWLEKVWAELDRVKLLDSFRAAA